MMAKCRSCGARIIWVGTRNGRNMPLDPKPSVGGNVRVGSGGIASVVEPSEEELYHVHFETCPDAKMFKRRKLTHRRRSRELFERDVSP